MLNICRHLRHEVKPQGSVVFNYGDKGNLFYIVIAGQVDVLTLTSQELDQSGLKFIQQHYDEIQWETADPEIMKLIQYEMDKFGVTSLLDILEFCDNGLSTLDKQILRV